VWTALYGARGACTELTSVTVKKRASLPGTSARGEGAAGPSRTDDWKERLHGSQLLTEASSRGGSGGFQVNML